MIGRNQITFNAATMMRAVQEFIDNRWNENFAGEKLKVTGITETTSNSYPVFIVSLEGESKETKP